MILVSMLSLEVDNSQGVRELTLDLSVLVSEECQCLISLACEMIVIYASNHTGLDWRSLYEFFFVADMDVV